MGSGILIAAAMAAALIFVAVAYVIRATPRLIAAALIAGLLAAALNIAWDIAAFHAGWWHYAFADVEYAPLLAYVPVVLVYGGALGLIGRRIIGKFGAPGAIAFFGAVTGWGVLRDHLVAAHTDMLVFGVEPRASVADAAAYLSVAVLIQAVLRAICRKPSN